MLGSWVRAPAGSRRTAALFKAAVFSWLQAAIPYMIDYSQDCRIFAALSDDKNLPMPINKDTLYFFRLIRSGAGLGAAPVSDTADTAVTPGSWERIYRMAADHGLSAVGVGRHMPAARSTATAARNPHTLGAVGRKTGGKVPPPAANGLKTRGAVLRRGTPHVAAQRARTRAATTPSRSTGNAVTSTFTSTANRTRATASCMRSGHTSISTSPSIRNTSGTGC